jgi:hypothetical protein
MLQTKVDAIADQRWFGLVTAAVVSPVVALTSVQPLFKTVCIGIVAAIRAPIGPIPWVVRQSFIPRRLAVVAASNHHTVALAVGKAARKTIFLRIEAQVLAIIRRWIILWAGKVDSLIVLLLLLRLLATTTTAGGLALLSTLADLSPPTTLLAAFLSTLSFAPFSLGATSSLAPRPKDGKDVVAATSDASSTEDSFAVDRAVPVAPVGDHVLTRFNNSLCIYPYVGWQNKKARHRQAKYCYVYHRAAATSHLAFQLSSIFRVNVNEWIESNQSCFPPRFVDKHT